MFLHEEVLCQLFSEQLMFHIFWDGYAFHGYFTQVTRKLNIRTRGVGECNQRSSHSRRSFLRAELINRSHDLFTEPL
uniref:hypothetical protein n=1 Tax=Pseudomonas aeruginosa TaxID=287 RepID=UPI0015C00568|nr:hypothetical protein [Pseudomonas aeruginosa]